MTGTGRRRWSPSRIRVALQCGRHLRGLEERWEQGPDTIQAIRGRVVHKAIAEWETSGRAVDPNVVLANVWTPIIESACTDTAVAADAVDDMLGTLAVVATEQSVVDGLSEQYKNPRASKAYKQAAAEHEWADIWANLDEAATNPTAAPPWIADNWLRQGVAHSHETMRRGVRLVADLWPQPDIIGHEQHWEARIGDTYTIHGYVDRVELGAVGAEVVDYKTSRYEDTPLDNWIQAATYHTLATHHLGVDVPTVRMVYLRDGTSATFRPKPDWPGRLLELVEAADAVLTTRAFAATFQGCGICPFYEGCATIYGIPTLEATT